MPVFKFLEDFNCMKKTFALFVLSLSLLPVAEAVQCHLIDIQQKSILEGNTPLHVASQEGDLAMVQCLLKKGSNIISQNRSGQTPLHLAVENNRKKVVDFLIQEGARVDFKNEQGSTPLHLATSYEHSSSWIPFDDEEPRDTSPLTVVKSLVQKGKAMVSSKNTLNNTPLFLAIRNNYEDVALFLLESGADIHAQGFLHAAVAKKNMKLIQALISSGVDINKINRDGRTAFHGVVTSGRLRLQGEISWTDYLNFEEEAKVNLSEVVSWSGLKMARYFIENGADINIQEEWNGYTPLHLAVLDHNLDMVNLLIENGASVNVVNNSNETPLYKAIEFGYFRIAKILIENKADIFLGTSVEKLVLSSLKWKTLFLDVVGQSVIDKNELAGYLEVYRYIQELNQKKQTDFGESAPTVVQTVNIPEVTAKDLEDVKFCIKFVSKTTTRETSIVPIQIVNEDKLLRCLNSIVDSQHFPYSVSKNQVEADDVAKAEVTPTQVTLTLSGDRNINSQEAPITLSVDGEIVEPQNPITLSADGGTQATLSVDEDGGTQATLSVDGDGDTQAPLFTDNQATLSVDEDEVQVEIPQEQIVISISIDNLEDDNLDFENRSTLTLSVDSEESAQE